MATGENFIRFCNQRDYKEEKIISKINWYREKLQEIQNNIDEYCYDEYYALKYKFEVYKEYAYGYWHYKCNGNYESLREYEKRYLW